MNLNIFSTPVNEEAVMAALGTVIEPELHRDLVSLNMIRNLKIDGNDVTFTIMLTTPACPLKDVMQRASEGALRRDVPGIGRITINWDANVPRNSRLAAAGLNFRATIAVGSGKGGVGKSTVSVNIAIALAKSGAKVGLLDGDILGPNIPMMMGVDKMPPPTNRKMVPATSHGVRFISTAFLIKPEQALVWRGPMLNSAIRQVLSDVEWGDLDYLVVDLPPGTGDAALSLAQLIPLTGAVVVTQPMAVAASDARRAITMFEQLEVPVLGVVENMSGEFFGSGIGEKLAAETGAPYLGTIPLDSRVRIGGDNGEPITVAAPDAPAAQAFFEIASKVAARTSVLSLQAQSNFIPIEMIG
jgi:ATP-binding protein involved in chromosome partitioning